MIHPLDSMPPDERQLVQRMAQYKHRPYDFVMFNWPWLKKGTALEHHAGPREWQGKFLKKLQKQLGAGKDPEKAMTQIIRKATASGHGIGKSALVAWLVIWAMSTLPETRVVVTANTGDQLASKTWPELSKWHGMALNGHWFNFEATSLSAKSALNRKNWRAEAMTWNATRPESFAGLHNEGKRVLLIFDEASAIDDIIWETVEGALTDTKTEIMWFVFGNPTRNTGRFRQCFTKFKQRWDREQIDSRDVDGTNNDLFAEWEKDYGPDSDFFRVRVRGVFPRAGVNQFIPGDIVRLAMEREGRSHLHEPLVMGVDVARFGDDTSEIQTRRGSDADTWGQWSYYGLDTMRLAGVVAEKIDEIDPDAVFMDEGGIGAGAVDRLHQLGYSVVIGVNFGAKADRGFGGAADGSGEKYANKRAEIWGLARAWLRRQGATLSDDQELEEQLISVEYDYTDNGEVRLERKKDMKARGLPSPDKGDAFCLTFSYGVAARPRGQRGRDGRAKAPMAQTDWDGEC